MANRFLDTTLVDKAIKFAVDAHSNTERRGKGFPYVIHVLEAMEIVATISSDPELLAAAALHDTVEDTDVTIETVRREFGDRIAGLVASESDEAIPQGRTEQQTWRSRKKAAIGRLFAASRDAKIVALGDKLSNMRAIARDYRKQGDDLWSLFHAPGGKADHEWHYRGLAASLSELAGTDAFAEFAAKIDEVFGSRTPETIDMADYVESGDGFTAISYNSLTTPTMIKLYAPFMPPLVPARELEVSNAISGLGLTIPKALRLVTDGKRTGVEFERIEPKKSISRAISQDPECLERLVRKFTDMCLELHSKPCDTDIFEPVSQHFANAVKATPHFTPEQKAKMLDFIASVPEATTCLHGDMHIGNVIFNTDTDVFYWIDVADFRYGNPKYDLAMFNLVCNAGAAEISERLFHLPKATMQHIWDVFIRDYYGPDADPRAVEEEIAPYTALYFVLFGTRGDAMMPDTKEFVDRTFGF